ncbi:MAG: type II toxin-antitoxin system RelE/ParE family toxin [Spirochaetaceae bacterium]|nr:type II toxin-antitoxin system RelE/ParE family toxin [Spirochaetaceae bacterium]
MLKVESWPGGGPTRWRRRGVDSQRSSRRGWQDATRPGDADAPGFRLHPLKGDRAGEWSVRVSGNWRVVFRFEGGEVVDVDLVDYH